MRERIVPAVLVERTVLGIAHRVFPLIACFEVGTFHDTSARETEDAGMQIFERLHQVGTQSVPVVFGEERHMVEVHAIGGLRNMRINPFSTVFVEVSVTVYFCH